MPREASKVVKAACAFRKAQLAVNPLRDKVNALPTGRIEKGSEQDRLCDALSVAEKALEDSLNVLLVVTDEYEDYMSKPQEAPCPR